MEDLNIIGLLMLLIPVFFSIVLHEIAHGYAAYKLGDKTAKRAGRLSLNPLKHVDIVGTVVLPITLLASGSNFLFGWAKPVPVNYYNLRSPRRDIFIVASAGIVINAIIASIAYTILQFPDLFDEAVLVISLNTFMINIVLIVFNILPIPPLDGSKIFFGWVRNSFLQSYVALERQGLVILIILAVVLPVLGGYIGVDIDPLRWYLQSVMKFFSSLLNMG